MEFGLRYPYLLPCGGIMILASGFYKRCWELTITVLFPFPRWGLILTIRTPSTSLEVRNYLRPSLGLTVITLIFSLPDSFPVGGVVFPLRFPSSFFGRLLLDVLRWIRGSICGCSFGYPPPRTYSSCSLEAFRIPFMLIPLGS